MTAKLSVIETGMLLASDRFECSACSAKFGYPKGYPRFCPECGAEFNHILKDRKDAMTDTDIIAGTNKDQFGFTNFGNSHKGYPGGNYKSKTANLRVRRVTNGDRDEAQIEISINVIKLSGRLNSHHATVTIPAASVPAFVVALTNP